MASLNERVRRLEARAAPPSGPYEMAPSTTLLLKTVAHARAGLDYADREHNPRLGGPALEPEPLVLTPEEEAADREATRYFLGEYLPAQKEMARGSPATLAAIERAQRIMQDDPEETR